MALPTNDHHVHSDGYRSDKGEPDPERMMEELADELEQIIGVRDARADVDVDGPFTEVTFTADGIVEDIEAEADEWGCAVVSHGKDWAEVRP